MGKRKVILPVTLVIALLFFVIIALSIGVISIPVDIFFASLKNHLGFSTTTIPAYYDTTIWILRLPRIIMSLLAGASLAVCGAVFQSIFRNPICDPYILGISSGASLGAAVAIIAGWDVFLFGITLPALITSLLTLALIIGISKSVRQKNTETLLLTGIAINFLISAVITLLLVLHKEEMHKIIFWTMGSLSSVGWHEVAIMFPTMILCMIPLFYYSKDLNIMLMGNDTANSLGVNASRTTLITLVISSVLIATTVSFCGVIGFIGLIIPHIVRLLFGNNNRTVFLYALFFGAFFLLVSDTLARTIAAPSELPVGSITAIAGAPYFIFLLLRKKER